MPLPKLRIYNRQKAHAIPLPWLRRIGKAALPGCLAALKSPDAPLASLEEIEITIVDDADIARVHADFLDDPTTTDVITFEGDRAAGLAGEICVSADTAKAYARAHRRDFSAELTLYLVHGWLHLAGYDDLQPAKKRRMRAAEARAMRLLRAAKAVPAFKLT